MILTSSMRDYSWSQSNRKMVEQRGLLLVINEMCMRRTYRRLENAACATLSIAG